MDYEVFEKRPADSDLLVPAIAIHQQRLTRVPDLVAADAAFYSARGEKAAYEMGVKRIAVPNRSSKSKDRVALQKTRWFKNGQKWRTGCEGRIIDLCIKNATINAKKGEVRIGGYSPVVSLATFESGRWNG